MGLYLGCDPGAKGAYCLLDSKSGSTRFYLTPGGKYPPGVIFQHMQADGAHLVDAAAIEDVHSLFGMSAKSNFSFGGNVQAAATLLDILMYPNTDLVQKVQPKVWQKAVGITVKGKEIKQAVADLAHTLYPNAALYGPKGGLMDGRADALMIAHYLSISIQE